MLEPVTAAIHETETEIAAVEAWLASKNALLEEYPKRIAEARRSL